MRDEMHARRAARKLRAARLYPLLAVAKAGETPTDDLSG